MELRNGCLYWNGVCVAELKPASEIGYTVLGDFEDKFNETIELAEKAERLESALSDITDELVDPALAWDVIDRLEEFVDCKTKAERKELVDDIGRDVEEIARGLENQLDLKAHYESRC